MSLSYSERVISRARSLLTNGRARGWSHALAIAADTIGDDTMQHDTRTTEQDTGLTPGAQLDRTIDARIWALRVLSLMVVSNCDIRLAIAAVAAADEEPPQ